MEDGMKLAILGLILLFSIAPLAMFLHTIMPYINGVMNGYFGVRVIFPQGYFEIYSTYLTLAPLRISFIETAIIFASTLVFCYSLGLVIKTIIRHKSTAPKSNIL